LAAMPFRPKQLGSNSGLMYAALEVLQRRL
jgi:hypothetical protein